MQPSGKIYEKEIIRALEQAAKEKGKTLLCPLTYIPIESYSNASDVELEVHKFFEINPNAKNQLYSVFNRPEQSKPELSFEESKTRDQLIDEVQNLIYALGFEPGPKPKGKIQNFALLFFALIESAFLEPLPWQKIKVNPGPKPEAMHIILKTAIKALNEASLDRLTPIKTHLAGEYDKVRTWFGGDCSLSSTYGSVAKFVGTISSQPGHLVEQKITEVEAFLKGLELQVNHSDYSL